jgi:tetratricopeptide (TPR) repeat protein
MSTVPSLSNLPYVGDYREESPKLNNDVPASPPTDLVASLRSVRTTRTEAKRREYVNLVRRLADDQFPSPEEIITILDVVEVDEQQLQQDVDLVKQWYANIATATAIGDHIYSHHDAQVETYEVVLAWQRQDREATLAKNRANMHQSQEYVASEREKTARIAMNALELSHSTDLPTDAESSLVGRFREAVAVYKTAVSALANAELHQTRSLHEVALAEIEKALAELNNEPNNVADCTHRIAIHQKDATAAAKEIKSHEKSVKAARTALDEAIEQLRKATAPKEITVAE